MTESSKVTDTVKERLDRIEASLERECYHDQLNRIEATLAELKPLIELAKGFLDSPAGKLQRALLGRKHG